MEIKIRVWDVDRKRMLDSENIVFNNGTFYEDYRDFEDGIVLKNIVVMQYTGLDDKNGLGIFEKDIIKAESADGFEYVCLIDWHEKAREYAIFLRGEAWRRLSVEDEIEVIGNIYENPELLEG